MSLVRDSIIYISDNDDDSLQDNTQDDDTYSMRYATALGDINGTLPSLAAVKEEEEEGQQEIHDTYNTDSPLRKGIRPPAPRQSFTPKRLHEVTLKYYSPEPCVVPEIVIVPPSTDRKRVRRSNRTPSKTQRIVMATYRQSRGFGAAAPPLRTVGEEGREHSIISDAVETFVLAGPVKVPDKILETEKEKTKIFNVSTSGKKKSVFGGSVGKKMSPLVLSPRNRTIGKRSPVSGTKITAQKIKAIILDLSAPGSMHQLMERDKVKELKGRPRNVHSPAGGVNVQTPRISTPKDINLRLTRSGTPTRRPVAKVSPFTKEGRVKGEVAAVIPLTIRGVRLNRRFELMMKHRNEVNANK